MSKLEPKSDKSDRNFEELSTPTSVCTPGYHGDYHYRQTVICSTPSMEEATRQVQNCVADLIDESNAAGINLHLKNLLITIEGLDELINSSSDHNLFEGVKEDIQFMSFRYGKYDCFTTSIQHQPDKLVIVFYYDQRLNR